MHYQLQLLSHLISTPEGVKHYLYEGYSMKTLTRHLNELQSPLSCEIGRLGFGVITR